MGMFNICEFCKNDTHLYDPHSCKLDLKDSMDIIFIQPTKEELEYVSSCGCSFVNGKLVPFNYDIISKWRIESIKLILLKLQGQKINVKILREHLKLSRLAKPYHIKMKEYIDKEIFDDYMYSRDLIINKSIKLYKNLINPKIFLYLKFLGLYKDLIKLIITKYFVIDIKPVEQFLLRISPL